MNIETATTDSSRLLEVALLRDSIAPVGMVPADVVTRLVAEADRRIAALERIAAEVCAVADELEQRLADAHLDESSSAWAAVQLTRFLAFLQDEADHAANDFAARAGSHLPAWSPLVSAAIEPTIEPALHGEPVPVVEQPPAVAPAPVIEETFGSSTPVADFSWVTEDGSGEQVRDDASDAAIGETAIGEPPEAEQPVPERPPVELHRDELDPLYADGMFDPDVHAAVDDREFWPAPPEASRRLSRGRLSARARMFRVGAMLALLAAVAVRFA